jgi:VanZ family protein
MNKDSSNNSKNKTAIKIILFTVVIALVVLNFLPLNTMNLIQARVICGVRHDLLLHAFAFLLITVLIKNAFNLSFKESWRNCVLVFFILISGAAMLELSQSLVPMRTVSWSDFLWSAGGVVIGMFSFNFHYLHNDEFHLFDPWDDKSYKNDLEKIASKKPSDIEVLFSSCNIGKNKFQRNHWVKIASGHKTIYRIARGSAVKGLNKDYIWISYDSQLQLEDDFSKKVSEPITVSECNVFERIFIAPFVTPNPIVRTQTILLLILSILSIILSIHSFFDKP